MLEFIRDNYIYILSAMVLIMLTTTFVSVSGMNYEIGTPTLYNTVIVERGIRH
jgi:hypothetical protein